MLQEEADDLGQQVMIPDLQKINTAGKNLLGLINDILDISKIEAGRMELYPETFHVATLVQEVASTLRPLVSKNANTLELHCPDDFGTMHNDKTRIRQVLFNLISNATKFTDQGLIQLAVKRKEFNGKPGVEFAVTDNGIGMSTEQSKKCLNPLPKLMAPRHVNMEGPD